MERNSCRIASPKASSSEVKTRQDGLSKHQRLPVFKDNTSPRPDSRFRPLPQKSRDAFDKRPRSKSGAFSERYRNEVVKVENSVTLPISKQGCKKINMNHLLNFTLAIPENRDCWGARINSRMKLPKYSKEQFLQANCQFVTKDGEDYAVFYKNPDILVEWSKIEEVRLPTHEVPSCPICLCSPVAAKITRCGHIYCWPCILHYLALTDKTWQKCPICFEAVHKTDLKSVLPTTRELVKVGQEFTMHLMKRERGSLFPVPATYKTSINSAFSVNEDERLTSFQKLLLANHNHIYSIIQRERFELQELLCLQENDPEACFIQSALQLLLDREKNVNEEQQSTVTSPAYEDVHLKNFSLENNVKNDLSVDELRVGNLTVSSKNFFQEKDVVEKPLESHENVEETLSWIKNYDANIEPENSNKGKDCYFYQADDGQHIYLHSINVRMLIKEFGSLENSPLVIKAKVVELERASMTEVLRKKLCYLRHLPLTCEFQVAELNLSSMLSKSTLDAFSAEVRKRKLNRNRKAQSEKRREKYIEEEENRKLGKYPVATYNLDSVHHFPHYDPVNELCSMPDTNVKKQELKEDSEYETEHDISQCTSSCNTANGTSFAQMLRQGHTKMSEIAHVVNSVPSSALVNLHNTSDDECTPVPEYRQSFSDAIQTALDSISNQPVNTCMSNPKSRNKKKRANQKLLFTTSMCRSK